MGSHSVTCHPTQVNTPRRNPSQTAWYSTYLPHRDGRLSWPGWLVTYRDGLPDRTRSLIQVLTRQRTACWSQVRRPNHYIVKPPAAQTNDDLRWGYVYSSYEWWSGRVHRTSTDGQIVCRNIPPGTAGGLQVRGTGLLGWQRSRRRTNHHPRLYHVLRYRPQGR